MAEINSFISKSAAKEVKDYEKAIDRLITKYGQLDKAIAALNRELKTEEKSQKKLNTRQKEAQKLRNSYRQTTAKLEQSESKLNKELIKSKVALQEQTKALREQAKQELGLKKRTSLFKSFTKSILAAGAGFLSLNLAVKAGTALLKQFFTGTQASADRLRIKLAGLQAQFESLADTVAKVGDSATESFDNKSGFAKALTALQFFAKQRLFGTEKAIELELVGKAAEELERRLIDLEKALVDVNLQNAVRRRDIQELIFLTRQQDVDFAKREQALKRANELENEILDTQIELQRERIAIFLTQEQITDQQIEQIANEGLRLEQVGLTLTKESERAQVVEEITKFYELQTGSLAKQRELENRLNELRTKWFNEEKKRRQELYGDDLETLVKKQIEYEQEVTGGISDELKKRYDANKAYLEKVEQDELMAAEKKKEIQQAITAEVINIGNLGFDLQQSRLDRELDAVQTNYDARINAAEGNSKLQEALARELAQKQYEIQTEQAKAEKNQALFNIAINTAEGVSKALAEGGIAGIALGALVTASGIAQAAIVSNQPMPQVPQFATGTDYSPSTFIAGDGGRELGITKDGQTFLTPNKSTLYTGMEGTQIIPNAQTEQILAATNEHAAGMINMDQLGYKLDAVVDAVEKDRLNVNFDKHGVWNYSKGKSNFIARKNSKFMS